MVVWVQSSLLNQHGIVEHLILQTTLKSQNHEWLTIWQEQAFHHDFSLICLSLYSQTCLFLDGESQDKIQYVSDGLAWALGAWFSLMYVTVLFLPT